MSAKTIFCALTVGLLSSHSPMIYAESIFKDPLRTRPAVLKNGAVLPGDSAAINCASQPVTPTAQSELTLPQAIDIALCHNTQIRSAWVDIKLEADNLGMARSSYLPKISASVSRLKNHTSYPDDPRPSTDYWGTTKYANLTWRLLDFGGRAAGQKSARFLLNAAISSHQAVIQDTLGKVVQAYFDAVTAKAESQSQRKIAALAQKTIRSVMNKEQLGAAKVGDTLQASVSLSQAQLRMERAQQKYATALAGLNYLLGLPAEYAINLPEMSAIHTEQGGIKAVGLWLKDAEQHPAIAAAKAKLASAGKDVRVAKSEGLPSLDLVANYYQNGYPGQGVSNTKSNQTSIGVILNVPIFSGFNQFYKVRSAQDKVEKSQIDLQDTRQKIAAQVLEKYAQASSALRNLQTSNNLLQSASLLLKSAQRRYDHGAADVVDLVNVQNTFAQATQEHITSLADWQSAKWGLIASIGQLGRESVGLNENSAR